MYIKRLKLSNYCQHHDVEILLDGNLILVVGENGHGKTNLTGAIQFAVTGEQAGKNKADLLSWGAKQGLVELDFEHRGIEYKVIRYLKGTRASISFGDETIEGIKEVNEFIMAKVGLDKGLARQSCFVQQKEVDSILFGGATSKEIGLQKLIGLSDISKLHGSIGTLLNSIPIEQDYESLIENTEILIGEVEDELKDLKGRRIIVETSLNGLPDKKVLDEHLESILELRSCKQLFDKKIKQEKDLREAFKVAEKEVEKYPEAKDLSPEIAKIENILDSIARVKSSQTEIETKISELCELEDPPGKEEIEELRKVYKKVKNDLDNFNSDYRFYREYVEETEDEAGKLNSKVCPWCGSVLESTDQIKKHIIGKYNDLKSKVDELSKQESSLKLEGKTKASILETHEKTKSRLEVEISSLRKAVSSVAYPTEKENELKDFLGKLKNEQKTNIEINKNSEEAEKSLSRISSQLDMVDEEIEGLNKTDESEESLNKKIESSRAASEIVDKKVNDLNLLNYQVSSCDKKLSNAKTELSKAKKNQVESKKRSEAYQVVRSVREFFHYDKGPKTLVGGILQRLNKDINKYLDVFNSEFDVLIDDGSTDLKVVFKDSRTTPSNGNPLADSALSGGQKVQLSIAFRFACYEMFAVNIGFMSLDEPTAYLDKRRVEAFSGVLDIVKSVAKSMNLQLLLPTHEESLVGSADMVIDVDTL